MFISFCGFRDCWMFDSGSYITGSASGRSSLASLHPGLQNTNTARVLQAANDYLPIERIQFNSVCYALRFLHNHLTNLVRNASSSKEHISSRRHVLHQTEQKVAHHANRGCWTYAMKWLPWCENQSVDRDGSNVRPCLLDLALVEFEKAGHCRASETDVL
jgi:hypothetical protein